MVLRRLLGLLFVKTLLGLMPQTPADEAMAAAERLRQVLARTEWPVGLKVTASCGEAQALAAAEVDDALRKADRAMYCAKHAGRDQVMSAST